MTKSWYEEFYATRGQQPAPWYSLVLAFLQSHSAVGAPFLEVGCGKGELIRALLEAQRFEPDMITAIDQSETALLAVKDLPVNRLVRDISQRLPFADNAFGCVVMAEVIEHLSDPQSVLCELHRLLRPGGTLLLTFPNYTSLPWLAVRLAAQVFKQPQWIVLQPIDHIFFFHSLRNFVQRSGFSLSEAAGSVYFPPLLYRLEPIAITTALNRLGLAWLSFHPLLVFRKGE